MTTRAVCRVVPRRSFSAALLRDGLVRILEGGLIMIAMMVAMYIFEAQPMPIKPFTHDLPDATSHDCFCVSRDGKKLAMNSWAIWDISSGKRLLGYEGKTRGAHAMDFSPDGHLLAVGGNYGELFLFDARAWHVVWDLTLKHGDDILNQVEFTPDGRYLVSASDNAMLRVWDVQNKQAQALFCFNSKKDNGNAGWEDYLRAWRALAGDKPPDGVKTFVVLKKPIWSISDFSISPDGRTVALATGTSEVLVLELLTGKMLKTLRTGQVTTLSVKFSGDGKLVAVGGGDFTAPDNDKPGLCKCSIEIWDVATEKRLVSCLDHLGCLAFSPDNKTLVSGGVTGAHVWDVATGRQRFALGQQKGRGIKGVAYLPDGKTILTLPSEGNEPIKFWDAATGKLVSPVKGPSSSSPAK